MQHFCSFCASICNIIHWKIFCRGPELIFINLDISNRTEMEVKQNSKGFSAVQKQYLKNRFLINSLEYLTETSNTQKNTQIFSLKNYLLTNSLDSLTQISNAQIHTYTNTQIHKHKYTNIKIPHQFVGLSQPHSPNENVRLGHVNC